MELPNKFGRGKIMGKMAVKLINKRVIDSA